ncbi:MAG: hypothetical protein LCH96_08400 [Actinobacteria bacterium]|nr:hypothetical protein [Actinomycetota bacterium]
MGFSTVELIGYLASALVVTSLAMTSVVRLRIVSLIGSVVFVVYGALLPSVPIILTNAAVAILNIWFLRKEFAPNRDLGAVPIDPHSPFLLDFLRSHASDIHTFHPDFDTPDAGDFALVLTRDGLPAGALVGTPEGSTLRLRLDYVMHAYRDSRIGTWMYGKGSRVFTEAGFDRVVAEPGRPALDSYLLGVGFTQTPDGLVLQLRS